MAKSYEYITSRNSPNFWTSAQCLLYYLMARTIKGITIHHWGDPANHPRFWSTVNWVCRIGGNTSAHEVIEAGRVACLIAHKFAAWACGNARGNATNVHLELNPRASDGDYDTAAERIADIRHLHKKDLPLKPHNFWTATACPGRYDLDRLDREARAWAKRKYGKADEPKKVRPQKPKKQRRPKSGLYWTVEPGDTLGKIADYYAVKVSELTAHNGIKNPDVIRVGQHIRIPGPLYWTVEPGDTLREIAGYYGIGWRVLAANAGIGAPYTIYPGQTIRVI